MDRALKEAVDALFDEQRVLWRFDRPAPHAEPGASELYLGVGARDAELPPHPRMLSWKLPQWRAFNLRSTSEAVLRSAAALDALQVPITLRSHEPTLDLTVAALLCAYRLLHRRWPASTEALVEYVSEWEQGRTATAGAYERALASVFYATMQVHRRAPGGPNRELAQLLAATLECELALPGLAALPLELVPAPVSRRLKADLDLYRAELSRGRKVQLDLPLDDAPGSPTRRIDALFLSSPQDVTVLKLLARPDREASTYQRGFELLAVHAPNEAAAWARHTISIAPESAGSLGALALAFDRLEGPTGPDGQARRTGAPRFTAQPAELHGLADPWYSDGYALEKGRSTLVAPPFAGTRLTREEIWETVWQRFHVGQQVHVAAARTVYVRPLRVEAPVEAAELLAAGWSASPLAGVGCGLLPSVADSFLHPSGGGDVVHLERPMGERTLRLALYPSELALLWVEEVAAPTTLLALAQRQAALASGPELSRLAEPAGLERWFAPAGPQRWLVYGAYRLNRARSTMLDASRSVQGLLHAVASGTPPTLAELPTAGDIAARRVHELGEVEHWFTATGGARFELQLEESPSAPALDQDFLLFLLTTGQRYAAFEIGRRMGELERRARQRRWQPLRPGSAVRGDVMLFINSLWYPRVSDDPDLDARYDAWRALHGMAETVESLRSQTAELDEFRKERFEGLVGLLLFLFLPITIVSGFFSGAQFNELELRTGLPWSTGGWRLFLLYTAFFSALVYGAVGLSRLWTARRR